jgi:putative Holliday junction resolvase
MKLVVPANLDPFGTEFPQQGRLAGIDYGTVRIGIAISDPSQRWVAPHTMYLRRNERLDADYFATLARQEQLHGWVVGLPIHCDGKESQKSAEARKFATWLYQISQLPVAMFDERFTSAEARRLLDSAPLSGPKKKQRLDQLAAYLILTHYLESRRNTNPQNEAIDDQPPP